MRSISEFEAVIVREVPRIVGMQIKAIKREYPEAWHFMLQDLGRLYKPSFLPGADQPRDLGILLDGIRQYALALRDIEATPMEEPKPAAPEPPARTMVAKARRRAKTKPEKA